MYIITQENILLRADFSFSAVFARAFLIKPEITGQIM
jgi:hypothetical protein